MSNSASALPNCSPTKPGPRRASAAGALRRNRAMSAAVIGTSSSLSCGSLRFTPASRRAKSPPRRAPSTPGSSSSPSRRSPGTSRRRCPARSPSSSRWILAILKPASSLMRSTLALVSIFVRRRAVARERARQGHRVAAGVGGGDQLFGVRPRAVFEPRLERIRPDPRAAADRHRPLAAHDVAFPNRCTCSLWHVAPLLCETCWNECKISHR